MHFPACRGVARRATGRHCEDDGPDIGKGPWSHCELGIEFALEYVSEESFGSVPETVHEKAFHLLRLLVANHPFVDGNKRTALNTTTVFYLLNSRRFEYDEGIREILAKFGTDEKAVDEDDVLEYLRAHTTEVDLNEVIERWRGDLVERGLDQLSDESSDPND